MFGHWGWTERAWHQTEVKQHGATFKMDFGYAYPAPAAHCMMESTKGGPLRIARNENYEKGLRVDS